MSESLPLSRRLVAIACGGFLGTISRYLLSLLIQEQVGKGWPYDIFLINVTGAFVLALITTLADATFLVGPTRRLFINVGFLGAYTTFSSLALGDVQLLAGGHAFAALLYFFLSLFCGVVAVVLGDSLGMWILYRAKRVFKTPATVLASEPEEHLDMQGDVLLK